MPIAAELGSSPSRRARTSNRTATPAKDLTEIYSFSDRFRCPGSSLSAPFQLDLVGVGLWLGAATAKEVRERQRWLSWLRVPVMRVSEMVAGAEWGADGRRKRL
jgi:hypothetical protein